MLPEDRMISSKHNRCVVLGHSCSHALVMFSQTLLVQHNVLQTDLIPIVIPGVWCFCSSFS